ncbi:PhzF family phenazine biosynthesis protein [Flavobacterium sp. MXW15]|uniref:PhzF family phenazine biosynthesis protein n=1 Tax=Xanthomonas chitinilytica TaxID=2989819 RepID=A0ABT3JVP5_9XANT|nr:PhzF family phenazine biosynthesis protein [Xanthomonas sp. H13-6]MCW4453427.1 PhzF family phenazine biosynthesis protein [Flavobacterium sp. MXW15]MCW4472220.1 PhzF family phenazine biosynthesis protein [Xanthomonas sp. H13-6]
MASRRFLQLDVFAPRPGTGNPLAVVVDADGLDDAAMQAIAAWLNLSETVFFLPPDAGADYRIRIFTPKSELPFAGHPSVGAAWAAVELGLATPDEEGRLTQQCAAGLLPVRVQGGRWFRQLHVRSPQATRRECALGELPPGLAALAHPGQAPALWNNGPDWCLLEARSEAELRRYRPEPAAIAALPGSGKLAVFAPADRPDVGYQYVVRAFAPGVGIDEDPVTGSANALVAAHLLQQGRLKRGQQYLASQGRERGRNGEVHVQVDDDGQVWIGGSVQPVIDGRIEW